METPNPWRKLFQRNNLELPLPQYAMHTDVYLFINRMLRLYTDDECRFCKVDLQYIMEDKGKTHTENS
jgi:hypothetical protein